jgi:hypothetical protein
VALQVTNADQSDCCFTAERESHEVTLGSILQVAEQPSPETLLPSSHVSQ